MAGTKAVNRYIHALKLVLNVSVPVIWIFKVVTSSCHTSVVTDHVTTAGHNLKYIGTTLRYYNVAKGRSYTHFKIKETLLIREQNSYL